MKLIFEIISGIFLGFIGYKFLLLQAEMVEENKAINKNFKRGKNEEV